MQACTNIAPQAHLDCARLAYEVARRFLSLSSLLALDFSLSSEICTRPHQVQQHMTTEENIHNA